MAAAQTTRQVRAINPIPISQRAFRPIPGLAAQQQIDAKIKQIYAADYADGSFNGRRALALRLIEASEETKLDGDAKFVFLNEARRLSSNVGDITTAFAAIDRMAEAFPISKLQVRAQVMQEATPLLASPAAEFAATSICMDLVDQCLVEGDYDRADALMSLASDTARRAKSKPYFDWIDSRSNLLRPLRDAWQVARPAQVALGRAPDDPAANLVVGKFTTFVKGDFEAGLPMLAKSADADLMKIAKADLETPNDRPSLQFKAAGLWWDLADSQPSDYRAAIRGRAGYWYGKSASSLDGLDRALAQRRLLELNPPTKAKVKRVLPPDALKLNSHWYRASIAEVNWATARRLSHESGAQLVSIETRSEGDLMIRLARGRILWLGASADTNCHWTWLSDAEFFYTNWSAGEPTNVTLDSHPVLDANGTWRTFTGKAGFICEWSD